MPRFFNVAGPCNPKKHYTIPAGTRCVELDSLVEQELFFVIQAPRQTGKTTLITDYVRHLNEETGYCALYCSLEVAQGIDDPKEGIPAIVNELKLAVEDSPWLEYKTFAKPGQDYYTSALSQCLTSYSRAIEKPLVIMFDEVDCLSGNTLVSFLRQIRKGYVQRAAVPFVHSMALVGLRNIRDYETQIRPGSETLGSASPFNIVTEALTIRNFNRSELANLYGQHAAETGQVFDEETIELIYEQTNGQPWLCNAVAREIIVKILSNDHSKAITPDLAIQAVETIILRRDTHIDSLLHRLKEERVRRVLEPMLTGKKHDLSFDDDTSYVLDLGLLSFNKGDVAPANPIYGEVIMRTLNFDTQHLLPVSMEGKYIADGKVEMTELLKAFQSFWRENSEIWQERYQYKEAAPHLIIQAWLQRIVNGGGRLDREYSAGRGRIDLCLTYGDYRYPLELKIRYSPKTESEGIRQLTGYMKTLDLQEGWLIIFNRDPEVDWNQKITWRTLDEDGLILHVVGC